MKKVVLLLCLLSTFVVSSAQTSTPDKMDWWKNAKFGMFIHWGIYSVPAGKWCNTTTYGEWIMHSASLSRSTYADFAKSFNPTKFNAEEWVKLAKAAGQKYIVITSKHHDGFAMFDSKASNYNVVKATPFKRDVIAEMAAACRKYGIKLGLYYSQAQDWYHPGGARSGNKLWDNGQQGDMMEYVKNVSLPQVKEILNNYGDIAILWWDTPTNMTPEMTKMFDDVARQYPNLITNNRLGAGTQGDLETPEQYIPASGFPGRNWEVCMTMNGHWGYNAYDENWKSASELIRKLVDIVSKGGNYLLNVGPTSEGIIPQVCQYELKQMGRWLDVNGEAIYNTTASPFQYLPYGRATQKGNTLYLHIFNWSKDISIPYPAKVKKAYLLADKKTPIKSYQKNGYTHFSLPSYAPDTTAAVLAIECSSKIPVQPNPTEGAVMNYNGSACNILCDNDFHNAWKADAQDATVDIELKKEESIQCVALSEPWSPWDNQSQKYTVEAFVGGKWKQIAEGSTQGTGATIEFLPVKARKFRLSLHNPKIPASLKEISLYN